MNNSILKRIYVKLIMNKDQRFRVKKKTQIKILNSFPEPNNYIQRSYYQFKSQYKIMGFKKILFQFAAIFLLIQKIIFTKRKTLSSIDSDLVITTRKGRNRAPQSLLAEYTNIKYCYDLDKHLLLKQDLKWFFNNIAIKYPIYPLFLLKVFIRMTQYRYLIQYYKPSAIAVYNEYSSSSSAMTKFCHDNNVSHFNYMHGEKIWYIRDSFFKYDRCYVWSEHYKNLFIDLRADKNQFRIEIPQEFLDTTSGISNYKNVDYCYYLANESHNQIKLIFENLSIIKSRGYSVRVRIHPTWSDLHYIIKLAKTADITVESSNIDINTSITSCKCAISLFSTVLFQSSLLNTRIIIDDLVSKENYYKLKELNYVAFSLKHDVLSNVLYKHDERTI